MTDKYKFELFGSKRQWYFQKIVRKHVCEICLNRRIKHGVGNTMIKTDFGGRKVRNMIQIYSTMYKKMYQGILVHYTVSSLYSEYWQDISYFTGQWPKTLISIMFKLHTV